MVEWKEKSTETILEELRQGLSREANYRLLFERYHDQVYRFFRRRGMSQEDCRDLTQDVFVSVYKGLKGLRDQTHFHSWLFQIARNILKNELERRGAKKRTGAKLTFEEQSVSAEPQDATQKASPMETLLEKERRKKLADAIEGLPPQMRRCIQLRVLKGLSVAEIASVMRISINTVKAHLHQARKALKEELGQLSNDNEL